MAAAAQLNHLLKWLKTFSVSLPCSSAQQISDGVAFAHIAHQIDPVWFDDSFLAKIKPDVGTNRIIKESNLKKVLEKLLDFYRDRLDQRLSGFVSPDVSKIADHNDETELCRMLQLLLGCAIHSDRKDEFIPAIMGMEEDVQQAIMRAIQELLAAGDSWDSATDSMFASVGLAANRAAPPPADAFELRKLAADLEAANDNRQLLSRKCDQLTSQVALLHDENQRLQREIEKLRKADVDKVSAEDKDKDSGSSEARLRRQIETLREKIHDLETSRDECKGRAEELERDLEDLQKRFEQSQNEAAECKRLKDEVDILRECAARAARAENTVESLRRKAEEVTKLKHDLRILEDKNAEYIQKNIDLEEELKKLGPWKTQLEVQRKQLADLQANLTEETKRADRFEFEKNKLKEKFDTLTKEKERLLAERDSLREANEELRFAQLNSSPKTGASAGFNATVDGLDMIPHEIKEKLLRLEHENRVLRQKEDQRSEAQSQRAEVYQPVIDGLQERIQQLETENRKSNKRVLELESQVEEMRSVSPATSSIDVSPSEVADLKMKVTTLTLRIKNLERENQQKSLKVEELEVKHSEQEKRASMFQELVQRKEAEMQAMEERYKKYIEKAKMVMKTLDPKNNAALAGSPEVLALHTQLREKDRIIESLEREMERHKAIQETEEQLVTTAFYNLGMQLTRRTVDQRLEAAPSQSSNNASTLQGQSFLARQRQAATRGRAATEAYDH